MRRQICIRLWTMLGLTILSWDVGGAGAASLEDYAMAIATAARQRQVLEQMREQADPSFKVLLIVLKEGGLHTWQGQLLILNDSGAFQDLTGRPILDASGQPFLTDDAAQVPLDEANILLLQGVLDVISLTDADAKARRAAALKIGNLRHPAGVGLIEKALAHEGDPSVRPVMVEALNKLRLLDPDPQVRRHTVEHIAATRAERPWPCSKASSSRNRISPSGRPCSRPLRL
jgi:hypothetical protein